MRLLDERGLVRLCLAVVLLAFLLRLGLCLGGANPELAYELTPARADALALGALGAVAIRRGAWVRLARAAPWGGRRRRRSCSSRRSRRRAGGSRAPTPSPRPSATRSLAVASALVILHATLETARPQKGRLAAVLSSPLLRRYGKYSYAIYVFHLPLHLLFTRAFVAPRLPSLGPAAFLGLQAAYFVGATLALLALGAASYRLVERPFLGWKRFFAARTAS